MKIILEYNGEESHERDEAERALRVASVYSALFEIGQEVFRPARKHGYSDQRLQTAIDACGDVGIELVQLLEQKYYEILSEHNVVVD